ncbi:MAG: TRAP transporter large permease subunit, partial [Oscillospiraceae bacterium]|nr:TRAP transporter large permease subunit [Oscillospiraceae bacterium]
IFIHKELKPKHFFPILKEAAISTASVLIIMCGANVLSFYMSYERIPHIIAQWLLSLNLSAPVFLLLVCLLFVFLGLFMEGGASIIILVPLLLTTAKTLGIDLVHFGLLIVYIAQIGSVTPPFGMVIFLVSPLLDIPIMQLSKALIPFIILLLFIMLLIAYVPALSTFLPTLVYG